MSAPECLCLCVHITDPEFLPVGNQRSRVFSPPPTDESREDEAVHHLTVHSFTCRGRRKTESEWWKWSAVKPATFYFAAGLTSLNSVKTGDGCHHKKEVCTVFFFFGFYNIVYIFSRAALAISDSSPDPDPSLAPHHAAPRVRKWGRHIIQPRVDTIIEGNGLCRADFANHVNMVLEAGACSVHHSATSQL